MKLLEVSGLVKRFGGLTATDEVDLAVEAGEIHAVIGPNGAGKTTLINQLSGELRCDAGVIRFDDRDVTAERVDVRALAGMGRSYQITSIFPEFSVLMNVVLAAQAQTGHSFSFWRPVASEATLIDRAHRALEQTGLAARAAVLAGVLAHGERRQLEMAMTLATHPKLLLLDEPMAGMSLAESEKLVQLLSTLKGSYGVLLVEHDMDAVFKLADRITVLVYGRVIACGSAAEIRANPEVRAAYLGGQEAAA
jgi:branched-chain amino acid transport system ATP-binding protein